MAEALGRAFGAELYETLKGIHSSAAPVRARISAGGDRRGGR
jgi:hypothetical protein